MAFGELLAVLISFLAVQLTSKLVRSYRLSKLARARGCQPPRKYPHKDPFFGLDLLLKTGKAIQEHAYLPELEKRYGSLGMTFGDQCLGVDVHQFHRTGESESRLLFQLQ